MPSNQKPQPLTAWLDELERNYGPSAKEGARSWRIEYDFIARLVQIARAAEKVDATHWRRVYVNAIGPDPAYDAIKELHEALHPSPSPSVVE